MPTNRIATPKGHQPIVQEIAETNFTRPAGPQPSIGESLDNLFKAFLPKHIGESYLTSDVIAIVLQNRTAIQEALALDPSGQLAIALFRGLASRLPHEMISDLGVITNKLEEYINEQN